MNILNYLDWIFNCIDDLWINIIVEILYASSYNVIITTVLLLQNITTERNNGTE